MTEIIMATKDWILLGHSWLSYSEGNYHIHVFFHDTGIANSVLLNQTNSLVSESQSWATQLLSDYDFFMEWLSFLEHQVASTDLF